MDDYGFTTCDHLYVLLESKEQMPDDAVDVLICIMHDELLINPSAYPKRAAITQPLALAMQKMEFAADQALCMVEDGTFGFDRAEITLILIILNNH